MIVSSRLFDPVAIVNYVDYIESTGTQHIDTGIQASSVLRVVCDISGFPKANTARRYSEAEPAQIQQTCLGSLRLRTLERTGRITAQ